MTSFQIILIIVLGGLLLVTIAGLWKNWASRRVLLVWGVLWIIGLVATIWPDLTTLVAHVLGIERGADLLIYCTTVAMLLGFFVLYIRLRRVRRDLTVLTRRIAMLDPHENSPDASQADRGNRHADTRSSS